MPACIAGNQSNLLRACETSKSGLGVVYQDPTADPDWDGEALGLPEPSFFFSACWARVLVDSYGYRPMYLTHRRGGRLVGCLPVMEVEGWPGGRRGVALPFTDECNPSAADQEQAQALVDQAIQLGRRRGWRFLELHGSAAAGAKGGSPASFRGHAVDLRKPPERLLRSFAGSSRRGIRVAERAGVRLEFTQTLEGLRSYYGLHCLTRKRHGLPPQPWRFFKSIQEHALGPGRGFVVLALHHGRPIAGAVFLQFGGHAVFKYGASDLAYQGLRPNNLIMWGAIRRLAEQGVERLSLGRTSSCNEGLRRFKQGWGSSDYALCYSRYDYGQNDYVPIGDASRGGHNAVFRRFPQWLLRLIGTVLYRYCG